MSRSWMRIQVYVLPIPITLVMGYVWLRWSGSRAFAWYVTLLPILYGYIVPGVAIHVLKKWRFFGPGRIGLYYFHHGFIWAANLGPALFISLLGTRGHLDAATIARVLICCGALHAYKGWIYDIALVRFGYAEVYNIPGRLKRSPEEVVGHYAPLCFFLIGLAYALGALVAYHCFVELHRTDLAAHLWAWSTGGLAMVVIPGLAYRLIEHRDPAAA